MKLSLIILNYKTALLTKYLLRYVTDMRLPFAYECIVVDNDTDNKLADIMREEFPQIVYIRTGGNIGYARGINRGSARAEGDYLLCLNTDIVIKAEAISGLAEFLDANPPVGIAGPGLFYPSGKLQYSCLRFPTPLTPLYRRTFFGLLPYAKITIERYLMAGGDHREARRVDWLISSCIMVRRTLWKKLHGFDERYFVYFADTDFCLRAYKDGGQEVWYVPAYSAVHYYRRESAERSGLAGLCDKTTRIHISDWLTYLRIHGLRMPYEGHNIRRFHREV